VKAYHLFFLKQVIGFSKSKPPNLIGGNGVIHKVGFTVYQIDRLNPTFVPILLKEMSDCQLKNLFYGTQTK